MANNTGIEYYPFNVDFFDDDKIALIEGEFGMIVKDTTTNGVMTSV